MNKWNQNCYGNHFYEDICLKSHENGTVKNPRRSEVRSPNLTALLGEGAVTSVWWLLIPRGCVWRKRFHLLITEKLMEVTFCLNSNKVHHPCYREDTSMRPKGASRISSFWNGNPWRPTALWSSTVTTDWPFRPDFYSFTFFEEGARKRKIYWPPSPSFGGSVVSPSLQILWSTNLCAACTRQKGSDRHEHEAADSNPRMKPKPDLLVRPGRLTSAWVNQSTAELPWNIRCCVVCGCSWPEPIKGAGFHGAGDVGSMCWNQDAICYNPALFKTQKSVTFSWDQSKFSAFSPGSKPSILPKWQFCAVWNH